MVGVNAHVDDDEDELEILRIGAEVERGQVERLERVRAGRDEATLDTALERLKAASQTDENLVPLIMDACRAEASVGEISRTLQEIWGTYQEAPQI
jgi:methylmalonyl-CoA mutase, N-terminal domain